MSSTSSTPSRRAVSFHRDRATWGAYLTLALFSFFLNIQGNTIPFLRDEFALDYRAVSLHPAALAFGLILCGALGEGVTARLGRRGALGLGVAALMGGAALFVVAWAPAISISGAFLMGFPGGLILTVVPATLAQIHGENRGAALGEANGIAYGAALLATLSVGAFVASGLNWRASMGLGIGLGGMLALCFARTAVPAAPRRETGTSKASLPAVYWVYWATLFCVIALEQGTLLWVPEFLEKAKGLSRPAAASTAAVFSLAMLVGRLGAPFLLGRISGSVLLYASFVLTFPGFALYWGSPVASASVIGLFFFALGIALLYPLILGYAIGVAGPLGAVASTRASLASGSSILIIPLAMGALADFAGLSAASLLLPALSLAALVTFFVARRMEQGHSRHLVQADVKA